MKEANLQFSVAVIPRSKPYDSQSKDQDWSSGYDFKKIGENSDFISIMSYDDPYSVGPVASLPYTQKILSYMLTQVPGPKISLGIPLYCWKWDTDTNIRVGSLTQKLASAEYAKGNKKTKTKEYDEVLGATKYTYTKDGNNYATWCESEESLQAKFDLINKYSLRGFSAWAIGQENTWFWSFLNDF
jgi:spore germination protein